MNQTGTIQSRGYRQVYWLPAEIELHEAWLQHKLGMLDILTRHIQPILISDRPLLGLQPKSIQASMRLLGQDTSCVIFDACSGFNPNAFATISGTLKGLGVLIVLSPPINEWPGFDDPEYRAFLGSRYALDSIQGFFLQRLVKLFTQTFVPDSEKYHVPSYCLPFVSREVSAHFPRFMSPFLSVEQQSLVNSLCQLDYRKPMIEVILADRGRGKSTSMGLALAQLLLHKRVNNVVISAPSEQAVFSLLQALNRHVSADRVAASVRYCLPSQLAQLTQADLIIIDEAAAIPVSQLLTVIQTQSCCWMATTLHGYEGNGQGFKLGLLPLLKQHRYAWQTHRLETPVRWAEGDPLEGFTQRLLLLDAQCDDLHSLNTNEQDWHYKALSSQALSQDENLLRSLFGLLVTAHYRTSPNDLRQLLDSPDLRIRVIMQAQEIIAVALLVEEGPLLSHLVEPVEQSRRRPSGDMIPQTWVGRCAIRTAASLRGWRVMRIAVHPGLQQRGIGSFLVRQIESESLARGHDFIATSFGASCQLLRFWFAAGFRLNRISLQEDDVTTRWPVMLVKAQSVSAVAVIGQAEQQLREQILLKCHQVAQPYWSRLLLCLQSLNCHPELQPDLIFRVKLFAEHYRSFDDSLLDLYQFLLSQVPGQKEKPECVQQGVILFGLNALAALDQQLIMAKVLLRLPENDCPVFPGCTTEKQQVKRLRRLFHQLLQGLLLG